MDANEQYESLINPQEFLKKNRRNIKLVYDLLNQARNSENDEIITNFINYIKSDGIRFTADRLILFIFDPSHPEVPNEVLDVATSIATKCNRELGIMSGMDFILNKHDGKWYYLEIQAFPAIEEWAVTQGIKKLKKGNIDDYINYLKLSLEARYAALMMCMQKKLYGTSEETKNHHLTLKPNK